MKPVTEIIIFTNGPAEDYKTWSNIPYFLTMALRSHGVRINPVNIAPDPLVEWTFNKTIRQVWKLFHRSTTYMFSRTWLHYFLTGLRIKNASRRFPDAQLQLFLTYSFFPMPKGDLPVVFLCDWSYRYSIQYFQGRKPDWLEAGPADREDRNLERADLVVSLFSSSVANMRQHLRNQNIFYLGQAINAPPVEEDSNLPEEKAKSFDLIFIGDTKYLASLRVLLGAFKLLKADYPNLTLSIVGRQNPPLGLLPEGVVSYGYLDKGQETSRELFYHLLRKARLFINTTPKWGGFSSMLEALAYYTPLVIAPFDEVVQLFGRTNDFISYCEENNSEQLAESIQKMLRRPDYAWVTRRAHAAVEDFTWEKYADRLLHLITERL